MANQVYNTFKELSMGGFDLTATNALKVMMMTTAYSVDIDTQTVYADISANEVTGSGYTVGGEYLENTDVVLNTTTDTASLTADNVTWTTATIAAGSAVIYAPVSGRLVGHIDFGGEKSSTDGDFTIQWTTSVLDLS